MKANELANALRCHIARHGDCEVELFIRDEDNRQYAASLYLMEQASDRVILKGTIPNV